MYYIGKNPACQIPPTICRSAENVVALENHISGLPWNLFSFQWNEPYIAVVLILINYKNGCNKCKIFNHQHKQSYQQQQKNNFTYPSKPFPIKYLHDCKEFIKRNTVTMVTKQR